MKVFKKILCMTISLVLFLMVSSCFGCQKKYELVECGDFICIKYKRKNKDKLYYFELSEEGKQKEVLVIPEYLQNKRFFLYTNTSFLTMINTPGTPGRDFREHEFYFESQNLKKIYIENRAVYNRSDLSEIMVASLYFSKIPNLEMIITADSVMYDYSIAASWNKEISKPKRVINKFVYNMIYDKYISEENLEERSDKYGYVENGTLMMANVQFLYNYENAPNEGYYWVDDIENGEKIEIIPNNPTREGYKFGGWYAEKECLTEFDFEQKIEKQEFEGLIYPENYVNYAYAKWEEN